MKKLRSLEMLRAVAALLVVMFHTEAIFSQVTGILPFSGVFRAGSRGVDIFFVLSGFIMTYIHKRDWGRPQRIGNYLYNRFSRIYPAVWVMTVLAIATYAIGFGSGDKIAKLQLWNIIDSFLLLAGPGEIPQHGTALVNVTWTLKYEIFFYVVFSLLILSRQWGAVIFALWQATIVIFIVLGVNNMMVTEGFYLWPICLEFSIGIGCALFVMNDRATAKFNQLGVQLGALLAGSAIFLTGMLVDTFRAPSAPELPDFLVFGTSAGLIIASLALLEISGRLRVPEFLVQIGSASYAIYIVHFSVISLIATLLAKLRIVPTNEAIFIAVATVGVIAGLGFDRLIDQPIQQRLRSLKRNLFGKSQSSRSMETGAAVLGHEDADSALNRY